MADFIQWEKYGDKSGGNRMERCRGYEEIQNQMPDIVITNEYDACEWN